MKECLYYKKIKENIVQCVLCPHVCVIKNREIGKCRTRKNINGKLISLSYGKPVAVHVDPLTKKPIYHMLPNTMSYSIGTAGCNLFCKNCQNWRISQANPEEFSTPYIEPEYIVKEAIKNNCKSISYTYSEFVVFYEYALDISKLAKKKDLKNAIVSNGYINKEPLEEFCKYISAANIDLKSFNENFYKKISGASLKPVLEALKILKKNNIWLEITNLIIPGENDNMKEIEEMCKWIRDNLDRDVPLHFSRFFPMYKMMNKEITPKKTLFEAQKIAKKYLNYVYVGNLKTLRGDDTYCPKCKELLVKRDGYIILQNNIKDGKCKCGEKIPGVWY